MNRRNHEIILLVGILVIVLTIILGCSHNKKTKTKEQERAEVHALQDRYQWTSNGLALAHRALVSASGTVTDLMGDEKDPARLAKFTYLGKDIHTADEGFRNSDSQLRASRAELDEVVDQRDAAREESAQSKRDLVDDTRKTRNKGLNHLIFFGIIGITVGVIAGAYEPKLRGASVGFIVMVVLSTVVQAVAPALDTAAQGLATALVWGAYGLMVMGLLWVGYRLIYTERRRNRELVASTDLSLRFVPDTVKPKLLEYLSRRVQSSTTGKVVEQVKKDVHKEGERLANEIAHETGVPPTGIFQIPADSVPGGSE